MADDDLTGLVRKLECDPIFIMSLNSKELFHSNLLAWLIRSFPAVTEAVTGSAAPVIVTREEGHTDLAVRQGNTLTIMELKTFALPELDQLERLAERFHKEDPGLTLLTLSRPLWEERTWQVVTYDRFAERLISVVPTVRAADEYAGATMARWLELLGMLHELAARVGQPSMDEPLLPEPDVLKLVNGARLEAAILKMRFQHVAAELRRRGLAANAGYSPRGGGIVEWGIDGKSDYGNGGGALVWGWQIQGSDFRLAMITPDGHVGNGTTSDHRARRHRLAGEHLDFFAFDLLDGAKLGPLNGFNNYNPAMTYRYMKIPGLAVGQAVELGVKYAAHARAYAESLG